jgi:two-component system, NarL family, nitrate/nitrite response regulator NarL
VQSLGSFKNKRFLTVRGNIMGRGQSVADGFPKLLIVENDKLLLTLMSNALHSHGYGIVGTAVDAKTALEYATKIKPDVAILDIALGNGPSGIDLANKLRAQYPRLGIIFCTSFSDPRFSKSPTRLLSTSAYLAKQGVTKLDHLIQKIDESLLLVQDPEPKVKEKFVSMHHSHITSNDIELLEFIALGLSNKQIAMEKKVTTKSCENAISRLAKKLKIPSTPETNQRVLLAKEYRRLAGKEL